MRILLITPPFVQLNTPYPATTVLTGHMRSKDYDCVQYDLGIDTVCGIFSKKFLRETIGESHFTDNIEAVVRFLQGQDSTLATRIVSREFLPEGNRFSIYSDEELDWAFGSSGVQDKAKHLATLYIQDLTDLLRDAIAPDFDLIRYAEQIAITAPTFDPIIEKIKEENPVTRLMVSLLERKIVEEKPLIIGFTVPFPGCLVAALHCADFIRKNHPEIKIVMGGGYVNTELRSITDERIFCYLDYLCFDDGELPLERIASGGELVRTMTREKMSLNNLSTISCATVHKSKNATYSTFENANSLELEYANRCESGNTINSELEYANRCEFKHAANPVLGNTVSSESNLSEDSEHFNPKSDFTDIDPKQYFSLLEVANPMHRLWSDGFWNKITAAHGCYWAKCAFCDTSLDYIKRYDPQSAVNVVNTMEQIMAQTGSSGFHFTDEALPPKLLKEIAQEILRRKLSVSYWGNVRFEKAYTKELCSLLAESGFIAASGGLEVASPRILKLINKGVTIGQATETTANMTEAGIMVHAYLMYGFPSQTYQETVDSLEVVRSLFDNGNIQSAFWHRFAMTTHSPIGLEYIDKHKTDRNPFANNGLEYAEDFDYDLDAVGIALRNATYNYMHGLGLDKPAKKWFRI